MAQEHKPRTGKKPPAPRRITRREMLRLSGALALGSLLGGCTPLATEEPTATPPIPTPTPAPTATPITGTVVWIGRRHEFTEEMEAHFEADNPGIEIEFVPDDLSRFSHSYGYPDMVRIFAPSIPQYLARDLLLDLTPYFEASDVLDLDDLAPANDYFRAHGPLEVGSGPIYGMCIEWSPDLTLFANRRIFEQAGIDPPDDATPLTYRELFALAGQLATRGRDGSGRWGYGYWAEWIDRIWMDGIAGMGQSLYSDDFSRILLAECEETRTLARAYFDLAAGNVAPNPLDPSPEWIGKDFVDGNLSLIQYGYWFSAWLEQEKGFTDEDTLMLPAPTWGGVRRSPTITGPGYIVSPYGNAPDAAWKAFEWYLGGEPARERARSGWGVPAQRSLAHLMPSETPFQQQVQRVLAEEIALDTPPLQFNPYLSENTAASAWNVNLERALHGEITFEQLLERVEEEVNQAIAEGMDRLR